MGYSIINGKLIIPLPESMHGNSLSNFLTQVLKVTSKKIEFDFGPLGFIMPVGVVSLTNLIKHLQLSGKTVTYTTGSHNILSKKDPIRYLDDCLFFQKIFGSKLNKESCLRETTIGLEFFTSKDFPYSFLEQTINWLKYSGFKSKSFSELHISLTEVINNIRDHSDTKVWSCFSQHYPQKNNISLAISDLGVGIPTTIRKRYPSIDSDSRAIDYASQREISSKSRENNAGYGIPTIIDILKINNGDLMIKSLKGIFSITPSMGKRLQTSFYNYPGTLIILDFRTDTLADAEEEDLIW
jgi:anti-sigma regulatory factor (Ser/Thr protein kinase)